jgi:hypothetical protein
LRLPAAVLAVALAAGCSPPAGPDQVAFAKPFDLPVGHAAELPDGLRIKFDRVTADSRCPLDVLCVTAGDATVVLSASRDGGVPVPLELHTMTPGGSQVSYANHTIQLMALQPYPRSDRQPRSVDYVATLAVTTP